MGFTLLLFGALFWNMYRLQVKDGSVYAARAESQRGGEALPVARGTIYFTDKEGDRLPAALDRNYPTIFAVPDDIEHPRATAKALASIVGIGEERLFTLFTKPNDEYEVILEKTNDATGKAVSALRIKGIVVSSVSARYYPLNDLGAHVVGFIGPTEEDDTPRGRYGIELYYDEALKGVPGATVGRRVREPIEGEDVALTIDRNIQAQAESILERIVEQFSARGGTVIVQEPATGKILAMGNYPDFDPNTYGKSSLSRFLNPAVQAIYEPGSIFKVITMAAGIDSGLITPETTYNDTGSITLNQHTIRNWDLKAHGLVTMRQVIEKSINTGAAFVGRTLGRERLMGYLSAFGVEEKTGIELPGEVKGSMNSLKSGARDVHVATVSFGQGVAVTPLQLTTMVSAIANKGVLMKPFILQGTRPTALRQVVSEASARQVTDMMVTAVKSAHVAAIPYYDVAGKTGTAQVPDLKKGGYTDQFIHSYAGFAPASSPRFTILFKLDAPQADLAGTTVVPAFRELAQFLLNYYAIPPDELDTDAKR